MTKKERQILKQAGDLIAAELAAGREVRIPNFGRFKTTDLKVWRSIPGAECHVSSEFMTTVRFKPFTWLKQFMNIETRNAA